MLTCPATEMVDGSRVLYFEQAFWRTPEKPFRQVSNSKTVLIAYIFLLALTNSYVRYYFL